MSAAARVQIRADYKAPACPVCGDRRSFVKDSRPHQGVRLRRRRCAKCRWDYTTAEQLIDQSMYDVIVRGYKFQVVDDREA